MSGNIRNKIRNECIDKMRQSRLRWVGYVHGGPILQALAMESDRIVIHGAGRARHRHKNNTWMEVNMKRHRNGYLTMEISLNQTKWKNPCSQSQNFGIMAILML